MTEVLEQAAQAHVAVAQAEELWKQQIAERDAMIRQAASDGQTYAEIAVACGISAARVERIVNKGRPQQRRSPKFLPIPVEL